MNPERGSIFQNTESFGIVRDSMFLLVMLVSPKEPIKERLNPFRVTGLITICGSCGAPAVSAETS